QKLMLALTRPKFFVPFHGEHRMLVKHSQTAQSMGVPPENMVVIQNGDVVELTKDSIYVADRVPSGIELVDSSRSGMVEDNILKERQQLAEDGVVTVALAVNSDGKLIDRPQLHLRGVVSAMEKAQMRELVIKTLEKSLSNNWSEYAKSGNTQVDWSGLKNELECAVQRMLRRELQGQPLLVFLMQTPEARDVQDRDVEEKVEEKKELPIVKQPVGRRRRRSTAKVAS
ncbi:MAG: ribonuclease J, partial [Okeania sp. SIO2D1]|nr:ribonuclease J [Okeania sp. SIO2D1]